MIDDATIFVAFLFEADHEIFSMDYGSPCEQAFLEALATSDRQKVCSARIRRGDILAHQLASKLTRLVLTPKPEGAKLSKARESRHHQTDKRALSIIIGDVANSFKSAWTSLDLVALPSSLGSSNVYCLAAYPMELRLVSRVDARLQSFAPYLGAAELDAGNPIHQQLFSRLLDCVWFSKGLMVASRWDIDEGVHSFGISPGEYFEVVEASYEDYERSAPKFPRAEATGRASASADRLSAALRPSPFERVASRIGSAAGDASPVLPVDLAIVLPTDEQLKVPVSKLLRYALSETHPKGKHKARLFADLLGISSNHWRFLSYQLVEGFAASKLYDVRVTSHGVQFSAFIQVRGLNDRTCTVETGWIIRQGENAQLTTALPAEKKKQRALLAPAPPWVPLDLPDEERWAHIFSAASQEGARAAQNCVPTPMQIVGYEVETEGLCGGAVVRLDARTKFGRWLSTRGYGQRLVGPGVAVRADTPSQSVERAEAWATAFARTCRLNGIEVATVERYLT